MKSKAFILQVMALVGVAAMSGCLRGSSEGEGCGSDWDCKKPLYCINGSCESAIYECWIDEDCPSGKYCDVQGVCHTELCYINAHCDADSYCDMEGSCQPFGCVDDFDCESDHQFCDPYTFTCVELGYLCWNDWDCRLGEICEIALDGGTCIGYCEFDQQCPLGSYCYGGYCDVPGCSTDMECGFDEYCDLYSRSCIVAAGCFSDYDCAFWYPNTWSYCATDGLCYEMLGCTRHLDCASDELCTTDGYCIPAISVGECYLDVDCQALYGKGYYCDPSTLLCEYWGVECYDYWDCFSGEVCTAEGMCIVGCYRDADCGANEFCDISSGQCMGWSVECYTDYDCANTEYCDVDGMCYPLGCLSDLECGPWEHCDIVTGLCLNDTPECYFDSDCAGLGLGNYCSLDGLCVDCLTDYDCPQGQQCVAYSCR